MSMTPSLPSTLTDLPQWVIAGADKIPLIATTSQRASTIDPTGWAAFDVAARRAARTGRSLGFVFTKASGIVGVDLDNCRDSATGTITPQAENIVRRLDSYTEVSQSGTGLHIICCGELPPGRRVGRLNGQKVETYDS